MDERLVNDLKKRSEVFDSVLLVDDSFAEFVITKLASLYVEDKSKTWWWDSLSRQNKVVSYGDNDGLKIIRDMVGGNPKVLLYVTDDESPPWPVFTGLLSEILELIGEVQYFEFALTDVHFRWAIFDTHHNDLVVAGDLVGD